MRRKSDDSIKNKSQNLKGSLTALFYFYQMKFLIVGLGNIGHEYNNTRHNIGFDVVNYLAQKHGGTWRTARYADVAEIKVKGKLIILVKPST